jgi:hypothetical protein
MKHIAAQVKSAGCERMKAFSCPGKRTVSLSMLGLLVCKLYFTFFSMETGIQLYPTANQNIVLTSVMDTAFPTISIIMPDMQVRAGIITAFYAFSDVK